MLMHSSHAWPPQKNEPDARFSFPDRRHSSYSGVYPGVRVPSPLEFLSFITPRTQKCIKECVCFPPFRNPKSSRHFATPNLNKIFHGRTDRHITIRRDKDKRYQKILSMTMDHGPWPPPHRTQGRRRRRRPTPTEAIPPLP
jgi:hypothetical protein